MSQNTSAAVPVPLRYFFSPFGSVKCGAAAWISLEKVSGGQQRYNSNKFGSNKMFITSIVANDKGKYFASDLSCDLDNNRAQLTSRNRTSNQKIFSVSTGFWLPSALGQIVWWPRSDRQGQPSCCHCSIIDINSIKKMDTQYAPENLHIILM